MSKWSKPQGTVSDIGRRGIIGTLLPPMADIPQAYHGMHRPGCTVAEQIFYFGARRFRATPREGVNLGAALAQIRHCLASYEPKQEHKVAGVGYLFEQFFEGVEIEGKWYAFTLDPESAPQG